MSYQERRVIVSLISTLAMAAIYVVYVIQHNPQGNAYAPEVFRFWGTLSLILLPVSIVIRIGVQILVSITYSIATKEKESLLTDERDRLIELRGLRITVYLFALGFFLAMGALAVELSPSVMFIILYASGYLATMIGDLSQIYFYRRGF